MKRDLYGEINGRSVGLNYQLKTFADHGLKANFMVESLFSATTEVGLEPLKEIVRAIQGGGHDIQLHPHPEWIPYIPNLNIAYRNHFIREYPVEEQEALIRLASQQLEAAGATPPTAFRAGGFAGNSDTLLALERCGIRYDSTYNPCYQDAGKHMPHPRSPGHATSFGTVQELPIAIFLDRPAHFRPAQICACSFAEMSYALDQAERQGWDFFVIVSHSFEMLSRPWHSNRPAVVRQTVVDRFEQLCEFLAADRDRFRTVGFSDLELTDPEGPVAGVRGKLLNTGGRFVSQAASRLRSRYRSGKT